MKKLLVMSDSHRSKLNMQSIMEAHEDAWALVFLGDGENDMEECELYLPHMFNRTVVWVKGNCDWDSVRPEEEYLKVSGHSILCTHGHYYDAKRTLNGLRSEAARGGYDIVLFGHTHTPYLSYADGRSSEGISPAKPVLFNPGAVADGKYGLIYIEDQLPGQESGAVRFELMSL